MSATAREHGRTTASHQAVKHFVTLPGPVASHRRPFPHRLSLPRPHLPASPLTPSTNHNHAAFHLPFPRPSQRQTPLHRGCSEWASPVEACV